MNIRKKIYFFFLLKFVVLIDSLIQLVWPMMMIVIWLNSMLSREDHSYIEWEFLEHWIENWYFHCRFHRPMHWMVPNSIVKESNVSSFFEKNLPVVSFDFLMMIWRYLQVKYHLIIREMFSKRDLDSVSTWNGLVDCLIIYCIQLLWNWTNHLSDSIWISTR